MEETFTKSQLLKVFEAIKTPSEDEGSFGQELNLACKDNFAAIESFIESLSDPSINPRKHFVNRQVKVCLDDLFKKAFGVDRMQAEAESILNNPPKFD